MTPEGYPDDQELELIEKWDAINDTEGLLSFIEPRWVHGRWDLQKTNIGDIYLEVSTGGWSGNEDIIEALQRNFVFWSMYWHTHIRGGRYTFLILLSQSKGPNSPS
jgi:hypothetical protein